MAARFEVEQHAASFGHHIHQNNDIMIKIMIISILPPPVNEAGQGTHLIRMRIVTVPTITVATICVNQILVRILGLLLNDGL